MNLEADDRNSLFLGGKFSCTCAAVDSAVEEVETTTVVYPVQFLQNERHFKIRSAAVW